MASLIDTTIYGNLNIGGDLYIGGRKVIQSFDLYGNIYLRFE